ncbi:diaminopimelate decarboxylase [Stomatohabitans albus]|uniref:diaminopimelate decarboxylase n=1 Tax=Stomatohabitans albus TaxID=3110766 RepID=UPI00300C1A76
MSSLGLSGLGRLEGGIGAIGAHSHGAEWAELWPDTAAFEGNYLHRVGGVELSELIAAHGSPAYVLDLATVESRINQWKTALAAGAGVGETTIHYASKALPVVGVCAFMAQHGLHVDVASEGELAVALAAGIAPEHILVHGNNKSMELLAQSVEYGVGFIVIDSLDELHRLGALGQPATVLLRLTPGVVADTHEAVATAAEHQKFGLSIRYELAHAAVDLIRQYPQLDLAGLHLHIGSNIANKDNFIAGIGRVAAFAHDTRVAVRHLNLGGGLGVPYVPGAVVPSITDHVETLFEALDGAFPSVPHLMVEPGRSLVGTAGITVYSVGTVKDVGDVRFVSVDGGMSDNPRPAMYGAVHTMAPVHRIGGAESPTMRQVMVAGLHCESGDMLGQAALPADLRAGDLVASATTGAYTLSMSSNYNRVPRPVMVAVANGNHETWVRRETVADVIARDQLPQALKLVTRLAD